MLISAVLSAQQYTNVGSITAYQTVAGNSTGAQTIEILTDNPHPYTCSSVAGIGSGGLVLVRSVAVTCPFFACNDSGTYVPVFAIGLSQPWSWSCYPLLQSQIIPNGAPGFDKFLLDGLGELTLALPMVTSQFTLGGFTHDIFSVVMYIQPDPAIIGCFIEGQVFRYNSSTGLVHGSNRMTAAIL